MSYSIANEIFKKASLLISLTFLILMSFFIFKSYRETIEERKSYAKFILSSTIQTISAPLSRGNLFEVEGLIQNVKYQPFVKAVYLKHSEETVSSYKSEEFVSTAGRLFLSEDILDYTLVVLWTSEDLLVDVVVKCIVILVFLSILLLILISVLKSNIKSVFTRLTENIYSNASSTKLDKFNLNGSPIEIITYLEQINILVDKVTDFQTEKARLSVAKQVAHDIRSPLAALDMMVSGADQLPEDQRLIIRNATRRINDIANNLLSKNRNPESDIEGKIDDYMLSSLILPLIAEKRTQLRKKIGIDLNTELNESNYGIFVKLNATEFARVLSNIINNSIEIFEDKGEITLSFKRNGDKEVEVAIEDNGKGIPKDVLPMLMREGKSFDKEKGNGLGLYHAKQAVESWGGDLKIESTVGVGTRVIMNLPLGAPPKWFLENLMIPSHSHLVILDDDISIHQVWERRFTQLNLQEKNIIVEHFSNVYELQNWLEKRDRSKHYLYLFDYEILGSNTTGLDTIEEYNLGGQAILVTSHYQEENVIERCLKSKTFLLPKEVVAYLPISIVDKTEKTYVLIDDDSLIRMAWQMEAKSKQVNFQTFGTKEDLFQALNNISRDTIFYIDSNLGDDLKGEELAKELFDKGYTELYMATGYEADQFQSLSYLKGVVGKRPPW